MQGALIGYGHLLNFWSFPLLVIGCEHLKDAGRLVGILRYEVSYKNNENQIDFWRHSGFSIPTFQPYPYFALVFILFIVTLILNIFLFLWIICLKVNLTRCIEGIVTLKKCVFNSLKKLYIFAFFYVYSLNSP